MLTCAILNDAYRTSAYFEAVTAGMDAARAGARSRAAAGNVTGCKPTALHYNAHIGPFGAGDFDEVNGLCCHG